jgi:hypothetical protein
MMNWNLKLIRQAKEILEYYGLSLDDCKAEVLRDEDNIICEIEFTKPNKARICLSSVWWNKETGDIIQWGTNGGVLTL